MFPIRHRAKKHQPPSRQNAECWVQVFLTHLQDEATTDGTDASEAEGVESEGAVAEGVKADGVEADSVEANGFDATESAETADTESTNGVQSGETAVPGWPLFVQFKLVQNLSLYMLVLY